MNILLAISVFLNILGFRLILRIIFPLSWAFPWESCEPGGP